jgi:CMP-N-acetylneuraminic acid synthetase
MGTAEPKIIAVIPARAGSKGFQQKNLANLRGVPLVERAINFAEASPLVADVVVTTNSEEVINIAKLHGSIVRVRPELFASDTSTATEVVQDVINFYQSNFTFSTSDYILYLQPTSPLRTSSQLQEAVSILSETITSVVSVSELEHHPYKSITLDDSGVLTDLTGRSSLSSNRQELPKAFRCDGNIFLFKIQKFLELQEFPIIGSKNILTKPGFGLDIDSAEDLAVLEMKIQLGLIELD